eukprot:8153715-Pyramimonas_sp.AAC.1
MTGCLFPHRCRSRLPLARVYQRSRAGAAPAAAAAAAGQRGGPGCGTVASALRSAPRNWTR